MIATVFARQLGDIVGINHILTDTSACASYTVQGHVPQVVVAPGTIAEVAQVLAAAHEAQATVVPWGGGTQQGYGHVSHAIDVVVRTTRLDRVVEYEPHDLTISVEAGMTLGALDDLLAQHGQMLPLDAPLPRRATIGGLLATAMDGPRRLGYGTSRDLLIGIRVVEATGRISKAGGMVVKNVSGFDMMKLYLGSLGTLAIIASANFKLIPRPRAAATIRCGFVAPVNAIALADTIHTSQLVPAAVEYLAPSGDTNAQGAVSSVELTICAEGVPAAVERHIRDVTFMAQEAGAHAIDVVRDEAHRTLWAQINDLAQTADVAPDTCVVRVTCLPSELGAALVAAEALRDDGLALHIDARALSGVAYLRFCSADTDRFAAAYATLGTTLTHAAPSHRLAVLAGAPTLTARVASFGAAPAGADVMRRIKDEFDPDRRLNPGRIPGIDT